MRTKMQSTGAVPVSWKARAKHEGRSDETAQRKRQPAYNALLTFFYSQTEKEIEVVVDHCTSTVLYEYYTALVSFADTSANVNT